MESSNAVQDTTVQVTARNDLILLSLALALSQTGVMLYLTVAALTGFGLADNKSLATLPLALQFVSMAAGAFVVALAMRRYGRRPVFLLGQLIGALSALLAAVCALQGSFTGFCFATLGLGIHNATWQHYRFAAIEQAPPVWRSRAIGLVLSGGILAALVGGPLANWSQGLLLKLYAGTYLTIAALCLLTALLLLKSRLRLRRPPARGTQRSLRQIAAQPGFALAVWVGAIGFAAMAFIMNSTPLAMRLCGFASSDSNWVIQLHTLGMFAPSFVTGRLVRRFGSRSTAALGIACFLVAVSINLAGVDKLNFAAALLLLGVGWNLMFVSATDMLADSYRPEDAERAQALNDTLLFSVVAGSNLLAGFLLELHGWQWVNLMVVGPLLLTLAYVLRRRERVVVLGEGG
ncbi:MFS transporter [Marinobacterium sedimentorum]|uniref:MFS transporter n=1 Tax=Marinobacterium sedimentorum TaxID=2927804 RepID=UPI0020C70E85|nr:MFS transporter [Marinobacterium sedimentorum]MCP8688098.1 MFS transporter [Marinobacterium sedimentorum]